LFLPPILSVFSSFSLLLLGYTEDETLLIRGGM
jgi:hypothetical protein